MRAAAPDVQTVWQAAASRHAGEFKDLQPPMEMQRVCGAAASWGPSKTKNVLKSYGQLNGSGNWERMDAVIEGRFRLVFKKTFGC